jgi:hypothetical protein
VRACACATRRDSAYLFKLNLGGVINTGKRQEILRHNSQYFNNTAILMTALAYRNLGTEFHSLYLPYFIDFRF